MELEIYKVFSKITNIDVDNMTQLVVEYARPNLFVYYIDKQNIIAKNDIDAFNKLHKNESDKVNYKDELVEISHMIDDIETLQNMLNYLKIKQEEYETKIQEDGGYYQISMPGSRHDKLCQTKWYYSYHINRVTLKLKIKKSKKSILYTIDDVYQVV